MPVYDYKCQNHGHFYQLASIDDAAKPAACPDCGVLSARVIVLPPEVRGLARDSHNAQATNERSQHEPRFSNPEIRAEQAERKAFETKRGCGCGNDHNRKSKLFYTADGKKMFPSMRPWMISH